MLKLICCCAQVGLDHPHLHPLSPYQAPSLSQGFGWIANKSAMNVSDHTNHTLRYHTLFYHTIPYHTIPHPTIPYHTLIKHVTPEGESPPTDHQGGAQP